MSGDELHGCPFFQRAALPNDPEPEVSRRRVLRGFVGTLALGGLGCKKPPKRRKPRDTDLTMDTADTADTAAVGPSCDSGVVGGAATGIRGNHLSATSAGHALRSVGAEAPAATADDADTYDLIIIGAGISGISSAIFYLDAQPDARILILDNHDEFGGHARRNSFEVDGHTLITCGGTLEVESHRWASGESKALLKRAGMRVSTLNSYLDTSFYERHDLTAGLLVDGVSHGVAHTWARRMWAMEWPDFFAQTPLSPALRAELAALCSVPEAPVGLSGADLPGLSYKDYIEQHLGLSSEATRLADVFAKDWFGVGADRLSAAAISEYGPGFDWQGASWGPWPNDAYEVMRSPRFPDGVHTIVRGLLALIKPDAFTRQGSLEQLFLADVCEHNFDRADDQLQLRLSSTALHVIHDGEPGSARRVAVTYERAGDNHLVYGRQLIMAGGGFVARRLLKDLPASNKAAAASWQHCPMVYTNIALRRWQAIADAGIQWGCFLGERNQIFMLQQPIALPGYSPPSEPDKPITALLIWPAINSALPAAAQLSSGRAQLEAMTRADHEAQATATLQRLFGPYGFDPADVVAVTTNRYGHGYGFFQSVPPSTDYLAARTAYGRISIAHTDSQGEVWAHAAIDAAYRAVQERLAAG